VNPATGDTRKFSVRPTDGWLSTRAVTTIGAATVYARDVPKTAQQLPADPSQLHLQYTYAHGLHDDPHDQTVERWDISIRHGHNVHDRSRCPVLNGTESPDVACGARCPAFEEHGLEVGRMTFFRIRLTQGMNAWLAMEEESQELYEVAQVLLDEATGYFTDEVGRQLEYVGTDLLVMDRVVLDKPWRGFGLGPVLAAEAINRLEPGCRAVACSPGVSEPDDDWKPDQAEWDRVMARIAAAWGRVGFTLYRENIYLLVPATGVSEDCRTALRVEFQDLCLAWHEADAGSDEKPAALRTDEMG
jgi:GNAT superfamily N-acetyltransferase